MATKRPVTRREFYELDLLAKKANQRIATMKPGQREAVEAYTHGRTFSRAYPKSRAEYNQRMREVEQFLKAKQTMRRGWEQIKRTAVESAGRTLRGERKYDLTDRELADIFKEVDKKSQRQLYRILDLIQAKKYRAATKGEEFDLQKAINEAVRAHISAADAIKQKTAARERAIAAGALRE